MVETKVRRSSSLKDLNGGFKVEPCKNKKGLACQPNPLSLSENVITKLGSEFCSIDSSELISEVLSAKNKPVKPVGRKQVQSKISKKEDDKNKKAKN